MRKPVLVIVLAFLSLWFAVCLEQLMADHQEQQPLRNAYHPFTVELQVRDR